MLVPVLRIVRFQCYLITQIIIYGSTTDAAPADYKNRIYIGNVSLDSEPQCGDCPCAGDANGDTSVDVLDIVSIVNNILGNTPPTYFECSLIRMVMVVLTYWI